MIVDREPINESPHQKSANKQIRYFRKSIGSWLIRGLLAVGITSSPIPHIPGSSLAQTETNQSETRMIVIDRENLLQSRSRTICSQAGEEVAISHSGYVYRNEETEFSGNLRVVVGDPNSNQSFVQRIRQVDIDPRTGEEVTWEDEFTPETAEIAGRGYSFYGYYYQPGVVDSPTLDSGIRTYRETLVEFARVCYQATFIDV
jgi:hypothetical protein